jgi:hypothetical protein
VPSQTAGSRVFSEFQPVAGKIAAKVDEITINLKAAYTPQNLK